MMFENLAKAYQNFRTAVLLRRPHPVDEVIGHGDELNPGLVQVLGEVNPGLGSNQSRVGSDLKIGFVRTL